MPSNLPNISLSEIGEDVSRLLETNKVNFVPMEDAPWWIRKFSERYNEYYLSYKGILYVATGHIAIATSKIQRDNYYFKQYLEVA